MKKKNGSKQELYLGEDGEISETLMLQVYI